MLAGPQKLAGWPTKTCHPTHPASIFHFHMLADIRFQHDVKFSQHFLKQNAGGLASPAKKINPASISVQPMLAGPRKLANFLIPLLPVFAVALAQASLVVVSSINGGDDGKPSTLER